jgi:hypothetical protein
MQSGRTSRSENLPLPISHTNDDPWTLADGNSIAKMLSDPIRNRSSRSYGG